jgi:hypothetical protein
MTLTKSINTLKNAVLNGSIKDATKLIQDGEVFVDNQMSILRSLISDTKFDMIELLLEHNKISFDSGVKELIEKKSSVLTDKLLVIINDKIADDASQKFASAIAQAKTAGTQLLSNFNIIPQKTTEKALSAQEKAQEVKALIDNYINIANFTSKYGSLDAEFISELLKIESHDWAVYELMTRNIIKEGTEAYKTLEAAYDDLNIVTKAFYFICDFLAILPTIQQTNTEVEAGVKESIVDTLGDAHSDEIISNVAPAA